MRAAGAATLVLSALWLAEAFREGVLDEDDLSEDNPLAPCARSDSSFDGQDSPANFLPATIDPDKARNPQAVQPFQPVAASMTYAEVGCFPLEDHDEGNGGPDVQERDPFCRDFKPENDVVKCRTGLPFYRKALEKRDGEEFGACMLYCLTAGLDIFGLVEPSKSGVQMDTVECRCGVTRHNLQAWSGLNYKDYLTAEVYDGHPKKEVADECPVRIGMYDEEWMASEGNDGTPVSLMDMTLTDERYVDEIFHSRTRVDREIGRGFGTSSSLAEVSMHSVASLGSNVTATVRRGKLGVGRGDKPMYKRDCAKTRCAAGEAWGNKIYYAFTEDIDSVRLGAYDRAMQKIASHIPCIEFLLLKCKDSRGQYRPGGRCKQRDVDASVGRQAPAEGVILVGFEDQDGCYTRGLGYPGRNGVRFINLGWCNSNRHIGSMIHETGHALGMAHEHKRADAMREYMGEGPFLELNTQAIKDRAIAEARESDPSISQSKLRREVESALYQYQPEVTTYMGSKARGGRTKFDYDSIMMYPADDEMWSNRRRSSQAALPGCSDKDCLDKRMGQTNDFSEEDVLQLRDMYGCLPRPRDRCPAIYGGELVDKDGDCACPSGTVCYLNGNKGCPFAGGQNGKLSEGYFDHECEDCRCVAPSCPASANAGSAVPDRDGDCKCPGDTICRSDRSYCPSSRGNNDQKYFKDTCDDCVCRAKCTLESNAVHRYADEDNDCACPKGTLCFKGDNTQAGCISGGGAQSKRYFDASCEDCVCKEKPPPALTCARHGSQVMSNEPDGMGDCRCQSGLICKNGRGRRCFYSGGKSIVFFSAECSDCACVSPSNSNEEKWAQMPVYLAHESCANAPVPTKCGAKLVDVGHFSFDLENLQLSSRECGRCILAKQAGRRYDSCERTLDGADVDRLDYMLIESASNVDLCCERYRCEQDKEVNDQAPCEDYDCGDNAHCEEGLEGGQKVPQCWCDSGFETNDAGDECIPKVPAESRCCGRNGKYMWVPLGFQQFNTFFGCIATDKRICPEIRGKKWHHERDSLCERQRFIYGGRNTPS